MTAWHDSSYVWYVAGESDYPTPPEEPDGGPWMLALVLFGLYLCGLLILVVSAA